VDEMKELHACAANLKIDEITEFVRSQLQSNLINFFKLAARVCGVADNSFYDGSILIELESRI